MYCCYGMWAFKVKRSKEIRTRSHVTSEIKGRHSQ